MSAKSYVLLGLFMLICVKMLIYKNSTEVLHIQYVLHGKNSILILNPFCRHQSSGS
jgi:hypothetical protein